jgi:hypothetical protein
MTCASRAYLEAHGIPRAPEELAEHNCMVYIRLRGARALHQRCGCSRSS